MSDMLENLLAVEKTAASLVAEAEAEANRRTAQARDEARRKHDAVLKEKLAQADAAVAEEQKRVAEERKRQNAAYRGKLSVLRIDRDAFTRAALQFIEKSGT